MNITFAYFADEETGGGLGAKWAVENRPDLFNRISEAVGELGGFTVFLPNGQRVYPLQIAERGMMWLRIEVAGAGGHAAFSNAPNPTVRIAQVIERLAGLHVETRPSAAVGLLVQQLNELIEGAPSDDDSVLLELGSFGQMALRARSASITPTVVSAGCAVNAIPERAEVFVDCRFIPGSEDDVLAAVRSILGGDMTCHVIAAMPGLEKPLGRSILRCMPANR